MKLIYSVLLLSFLLSACTSKVTIDNPTEAAISITIDGNTYQLEALSSEKVELKTSELDIVVTDAENKELLNSKVTISGDGVLNPTQSEYVIWKDLYCDVEDYDTYKSKLNIQDLVIVNEKEYEEIDFVVTKDLFIAKNWDFSLEEAFPEEIKLTNDYAIRSKLYNVAQLEEEFGYFGDIDFSDFDEESVQEFIDSLGEAFSDDTIEEEL